MTTEPYTYFQPGELIFLLTQEGNTPINEQIPDFDDAMNIWIPFVDSQLKEHNERLTIYRRPDRELHFEGTMGGDYLP